MEQALTHWLLSNRPYTHLHTRVRQFVIACRELEPRLSYSKIRRHVREIMDNLMLGNVGKAWLRDRAYERVLRLYGNDDQRTSAWHAKRGEMITASEVYKIFGTTDSRREVMLRKLEPAVPSGTTNTIPALLWGTRFEPIAKRIYEQRTNCKILDVSCVQHPRYPFLGASPDGLIVPHDETDISRYGRLVEFKCPISRAERPEIPIAYIHQMQMQMECTGIDECEYVEFRFRQVQYTEWFNSSATKGCFAVYDDGKVVYDVETIPEDGQVIYWVLVSTKSDLVLKDLTWITSHIDELTSFWNGVLDHRANGTRPEEKKLPSLDL